MAECSTVGGKINTLEDSLKQFDMQYLIKRLDISLDLVRRNKLKEEDHLDVLKSVDKNLLKLSLTHHPDKATSEKKSDREIANAQKQQAALNATRTVLRALTNAFLEDIDIHYRYYFFAKMDISTLINDKEMDRQINYVLCKISLLSEVKRVYIVGEIRKFLLESRESLRRFLDDNKDEFERHRDYALLHFHKCIEGYEALVTECELTVEECESENDGITREAIQELTHRSITELKILQKLERVSERSLDGNLQIFSIYELADTYDYYLVSPFVLYINVMLMCTSVVNRKPGIWKKVVKILCSPSTDKLPQFNKEPAQFLKAYHLVSYFINKTQYERDVEIILQRKSLATTSENIITEFKDAVKNIEIFLAEEFDIKTYREGKSNREKFSEKLSKLNESITGYIEIEKELQEKLSLCKEQTNEIRKEYLEFSQTIQETEQENRENISKCINTSEEIAILALGCNQKEDTRIGNFNPNKARENEICSDATDNYKEMKLVKLLEQYEKTANNLLECLTNCTQNVTKIQEDQSSIDSRIDCSPVTQREVRNKIVASYELNKKINDQLCYLMSQTLSKTTKRDSSITEENWKDFSLPKLNYVSVVDETRERSEIYDTQSFDWSASGQNVTENAQMVDISPRFHQPTTCPFQKKNSGDLQKNEKIKDSGDMGRNGELKVTFDKKDCTEIAKSHFLPNEEEAKGEIKILGTRRPVIFNESSEKKKNGNKNNFPVGSSFTECSVEEIAEECEEHFRKMDQDRTAKCDEAVEEGGKGADTIEERKDGDSKNQLCGEELFSDSSATIPDIRSTEISAVCVKTADKIREISDLYDTQLSSSSAINKTI